MVLAVLALGGGTGAAAAQDATGPETGSGRGYEVRIDGAPEAVREPLRQASQLLARQSEPLAGISALRRRARADTERLHKVMQANGYFEATVTFTLDLGDAAAVPPAVPPGVPVVSVQVDPGPQFTLGETRVIYQDAAALAPTPADLPRSLADMGAVTGAPAVAKDILDAEKALIADIRRRGFAFVKTDGRRALADVDAHILTVTTFVVLGERARFGDLTVEGLERTAPEFIEQRRTFARGEQYDPQKLTDMRADLVRTSVFDVVRFDTAPELAADGTLPVTLTVKESPARSIGLGGRYSTDEGFGIDAFWEHRNLGGKGEDLRLAITLGQIEQGLAAIYRVNGFRRADQALELDLILAREDTNAFNRYGFVMSAALEREITPNWTVRGGLLADVAEVDGQTDPSATASLVGMPLQARYDNTDNALDPARGVRLQVGLTPYGGHFNEALVFNAADAQIRTYAQLADDKRLILALRAAIGSLHGAETDEIPADKRFYAGGADTVRGFEFQDISPRDENGDRLGGRSFLGGGAELRWRFRGNFGLVPFVDAGLVSDTVYPDFGEDMQVGAGLGFRYYTPVGPLGIDVAYPVTRPINDSRKVLVYIKLGQAF